MGRQPVKLQKRTEDENDMHQARLRIMALPPCGQNTTPLHVLPEVPGPCFVFSISLVKACLRHNRDHAQHAARTPSMAQ